MNYNFEHYNKYSLPCFLSVRKAHVGLSKKLTEMTGDARTYDLLIDKEHKAIGLISKHDESGKFEVKISGKNKRVNASVSRLVPIGRYVFSEKKDDMLIFLYTPDLCVRGKTNTRG
jgi:predicted RNA-binding protein (virulence factor B family)